MTDFAYDPYRQQRHLQWRNRIAQWRAEPNETGFHLFALTLLALLLGLLLWQLWPRLMTAVGVVVRGWPTTSAVLGLVLLTGLQSAALRRQNSYWSRHWLGAQPIPESTRRRIQVQQTLLRATAHGMVGGVLLLGARIGADKVAIWIGIVMLAAVLGWRSAGGGTREPVMRREAVFSPRGPGSFWTWQWTEGAASLTPYRVSRLLWLVLLVPSGQWLEIGLALLLVALGIAAIAWSRSLAVLPAAERWLAAQPLRARDLLWRCAAYPALLLAAVDAGLALLLLASGNARWCLALSAVVILPATLHWACTAAERHRRRRIGIQLTLHLVILVATLQTIPVLVVPVWFGQIVWLLRKGLRT